MAVDAEFRQPTFADVQAAHGRLAGHAVRTPLVSSPTLDRESGGRILFKAEPLQRTGSFKFRGALNALSLLGGEARRAGVVTCSSGNHAQGIAAAAALLGIPATIVMPDDAPAIKRDRTAALGARVVPYDRATGDREAIAAEIGQRTGAVYVAPYDDPAVIAGQGTVGLELAEQVREAGCTPDIVLVPAGGGGLTAGIALALSELAPGARLFTVEPEGFDDHARSLAAGERVANTHMAGSVCDALLAPCPGELTFAISRPRLAGGYAVSDADALAAVACAWAELKLVVEPGGAVGLAAILAGQVDTKGRTAVVVLSGGNADPAVYARALGQAGG